MSTFQAVLHGGGSASDEPWTDAVKSICTLQRKLAAVSLAQRDHCLLLHYMKDKSLSRISCIIIDEAHKRSLSTDLLLAMIKSLLSRRPDLRLIIMVTTADVDKLADFFFSCGTIHVVDRNFPIDIKYVPSIFGGARGTGSSTMNASEVLKVVTEIHKIEEDGAILTSQVEVEWA